MFVNLHNHSDYSIFDGFQTVEEMVQRAKELGQTALGLCDHGTSSGLYKFRKVCLANGIRPVMGIELYFTTHNIKDKEDIYHIGVWAKTGKGLQTLYKLTTLAHQNFYNKPRLTFEMIKEHNEDVVITSACCGGVLSNVDGFEWAQKFQKLLGDRFIIELFATDDDKVREYNKFALSIAQSLGIKTIISTDAHYSSPSRTEVHKRWKSCGEDNYFQGHTYYLMSEDDVYKFTTDHLPEEVVTESISNTHDFAMSCDVEIETGKKHYPHLEITNPKETLMKKCREGYKLRRLTELSPHDKRIYGERVQYEVSILEKAGYIDYLLITADIIDFARRNNILCGIGRGSVVASLVAYLLGITHLDPIKYDLVFERFCNLERVTAPDVDSDFESLRREDILGYIREKYGEVYQVRTINALGIRGAIQRSGQVLGRDAKLMDEYSKVFGDNTDKMPDLELKALTEQFSGYIQNYGVHASAVAVFPSDPNEWCAIEKQKENYVVAYDYHELEEMGLLKIDILGLKTLDIIHDTLREIPEDIDIYHLEDDKNVFDMLSRGETMGCFQVESKGMTDTIKKMKPTTISNLFDLVALYRPGITDAGMLEPYLNKTAKAFHPNIEGITSQTRNVIIYQEQIMQIVQKVANYTLGEADMLRRGIGRKEKELVEKIGIDFLQRTMDNGYSKLEAESIWENIEKFARYGFNHCLSGKEVIFKQHNQHTKDLTISEMYKIKNDLDYAKRTGHYSLYKKYNRYGYGNALSMCSDGRLRENKIIDIYFSGTRQTYKIITESGKSVICTDNHKFPTTSGEKMTKDLVVGDCLYTKGQHEIKKIDYSFYGGELFDSNFPKKGQVGFQKISGKSVVYKIFQQNMKDEPCQQCHKSHQRCETHHIDGNRTNNATDNFIWLCPSCHKKAHYAMGRTKKYESGIPVITERIVQIQLYSFEDVFDVEMADPNHNFLLGSGIITSNSHAGAYGYTSYITAYLKCYYPKQFFAAVLNHAKREDISDYIAELRRLDIDIIPPRLDEPVWRATEDGIIVGLSTIKDIGNGLEGITIDKPESMWYNINKKVSTALVKAGVWPGDRNLMLAQIEWWKDKRKKKIPYEEVKATTNYTDAEMEFDVLGFSFDAILSAYDDTLCQQNKNCKLGTVVSVKPWKTKKGKPMVFAKVNLKGVNKDLVCFDDSICFGLKVGKTYVLKIEDTQIKDYMEAKRR